jgi:hypothetical protein
MGRKYHAIGSDSRYRYAEALWLRFIAPQGRAGFGGSCFQKLISNLL